jgi:hypothetical protein
MPLDFDYSASFLRGIIKMNKNQKSHKIQIGKVKIFKGNKHVFPEDLFTQDDVNRILEDLQKIKPSMKSLIVLWQDEDNTYWEITKDTNVSTAVWMLETAKFDLLKEDD